MQNLPLTLTASKYGWYTNDITWVTQFVKSLTINHKIWLAGGALRRMVMGGGVVNESDFDFFFVNEIGFFSLRQALLASGCRVVRENTFNSTLEMIRGQENGKDRVIKFQLIRIAYYSSIETLLESFDFTLCQFGLELFTDTLVCGDMSLYDVARKRLVINRITYPVASMQRIIKYTQQGFYACQGMMTEFLIIVANQPELLTSTIKYID